MSQVHSLPQAFEKVCTVTMPKDMKLKIKSQEYYENLKEQSIYLFLDNCSV